MRDDLRSRLRFDYQVCQTLFGDVFVGEAYRNPSDSQRRRNQITSLGEAHRARMYRVDFQVRTLIGPGVFRDVTTIEIDLNRRDYPLKEPICSVISTPIPYSPHFAEEAAICIGDIWKEANGRMLLGELLIYIARILNWDNTTDWDKDGGHEAAQYYQRVYGRNPLNKAFPYPQIPAWLFDGSQTTAGQQAVTNPPRSQFGGPGSVARSDAFRVIRMK